MHHQTSDRAKGATKLDGESRRLVLVCSINDAQLRETPTDSVSVHLAEIFKLCEMPLPHVDTPNIESSSRALKCWLGRGVLVT